MPRLNANYYNRGVPAECDAKMESYLAAGHRMVCVAFPPQGGNSWSLITDKTFFNRNIPDECHAKINEYHDAGHKIQCVAFPPKGGNSWSVITDKTFFNRNIPDECHDKMNELVDLGQKVRWVAFPPKGGNSWSLITDKSFFNRNIPDECHDKMKELHAAGHRPHCVAFPKTGDHPFDIPLDGNSWSVIAGSKFFNRHVPDLCHRTMRAMTGCGMGPLRVVAYPPDGGFSLIARADALYAADPVLTAGLKSFSLTAFIDGMRAQLQGKGCKYGLVVRLGPALRTATDGPARTAMTPPERDYSIFDLSTHASVTKTITAVALLSLIQQKNLKITEPIAKHLPDSWRLGPNIDTITVAELLNHTSGIRGGVSTYDDLEDLVADGVKLADKAESSYSNANYNLARIVVAHLKGGIDEDSDQAEATSKVFRAHVQKAVFDKLGIPDVLWKAEGQGTLFYPTPVGVSTGTTYGDSTETPGSTGVRVSLAELSMFVERMAETDDLLSAFMRSEMDEHALGWVKTTDVDEGFYHRKRGYHPAGKNGGAELNTGIYKFSNGVQVALLHNGPGGVNVANAYDAAWT
jgi:CubicO group peptidase (beta-lactamase class C family)